MIIASDLRIVSDVVVAWELIMIHHYTVFYWQRTDRRFHPARAVTKWLYTPVIPASLTQGGRTPTRLLSILIVGINAAAAAAVPGVQHVL